MSEGNISESRTYCSYSKKILLQDSNIVFSEVLL